MINTALIYMITTTTIAMISITGMIIRNTPHVPDNARIRKENHCYDQHHPDLHHHH